MIYPDYYWPGGGLLHDGKLLVLFMRARDAEGELQLQITTGWGAALIDNLRETPDNWRVTKLAVPQNNFDVLVGSGTVIVDGEFVKAFSASWGQRSRHASSFVGRWPMRCLAISRDPEWWAGDESWLGRSSEARRTARLRSSPRVARNSWCYIPKNWVSTCRCNSRAFRSRLIGARFAPALKGPWTPLRAVPLA